MKLAAFSAIPGSVFSVIRKKTEEILPPSTFVGVKANDMYLEESLSTIAEFSLIQLYFQGRIHY